MKRVQLAALGASLFVMVLAGCEGSDDTTVETPPADESADAVEAPESDASEAPSMLEVASNAEYDGYLADGEGRALYLLESDAPGESSCTDACAETWPPYVVEAGARMAGNPELRQELLGTTSRDDGTTQLTYGGHPLYYYSEDTGAGDVNGQEVTDEWGEWYLVTPDGEPLDEGEEGGEAEAG